MNPNWRRWILTALMVLTYTVVITHLSSWHTVRLLEVCWRRNWMNKLPYDAGQFLVIIGWCYWVPSIAYRGLSPLVWWGHLIYATLLWLPRAFWVFALRQWDDQRAPIHSIAPADIRLFHPEFEPDTNYCAAYIMLLCFTGAVIYQLNALRRPRPCSLGRRTFRLWSRLILFIALAMGWDYVFTWENAWYNTRSFYELFGLSFW